MTENALPPETAAIVAAKRAANTGPLRTSALRKICSALRAELPALGSWTGTIAPSTTVATTLPGVCRITAQWTWIVRGRQPGEFCVLYKAYKPDGGYLVHRVGSSQFASELSHKLRQLARATPTPRDP